MHCLYLKKKFIFLLYLSFTCYKIDHNVVIHFFKLTSALITKQEKFCTDPKDDATPRFSGTSKKNQKSLSRFSRRHFPQWKCGHDLFLLLKSYLKNYLKKKYDISCSGPLYTAIISKQLENTNSKHHLMYGLIL